MKHEMHLKLPDFIVNIIFMEKYTLLANYHMLIQNTLVETEYLLFITKIFYFLEQRVCF